MTTGSERRATVLERVKGLICRDRQNTHGDAEENFADIARHWSIYLSRRLGRTLVLEAFDVAAMEVLLKTARAAANPHHLDNWDDIVGYGGCGAGIVESAQENAAPRHQEGLRDLARSWAEAKIEGERRAPGPRDILTMRPGETLEAAVARVFSAPAPQDAHCTCGARISEHHKPGCPRREQPPL